MADLPHREIIRLCERVLAADITEAEILQARPEEPENPLLAKLRRRSSQVLSTYPAQSRTRVAPRPGRVAQNRRMRQLTVPDSGWQDFTWINQHPATTTAICAVMAFLFALVATGIAEE